MKIHWLQFLFLMAFFTTCQQSEKAPENASESNSGETRPLQINNPVIRDKFTAGPAALVHIEVRGMPYFIYHTGGVHAPNFGGSFRRPVGVDRLFYNEDGTLKRVLMTSEGIQK